MWMTVGNEEIYRFAKPNPAMKAWIRALSVAVVVGCAFLVAFWAVGSICGLALGVLIMLWLLSALLGVGMTVLDFRRAVGVTVTPNMMAVFQALSRQEYYWRDVQSVSLSTWREGGLADAFFGWLFYGSDADVSFVKISLRPAIRMPWWTAPTITRGWVIPIVGANTVRVWLQDSEGFVRDVQKYVKRESRNVG